MRLTRSVYNKVFDFIRMDMVCQLFGEVIFNPKKSGITIAFGGASIVFIREIPMLRKYNLHARVISWSPKGKWLYIQGVFTLPPSKKPSTDAKRQLPTLLNNLNADSGIVSGTSTPTNVATSSQTTMNGETICAVIYGRYVFKRRSKETVPVNEVLGICGYSGDEEIEKRRAEGWEYVRGLEHDWDKNRALESARQI